MEKMAKALDQMNDSFQDLKTEHSQLLRNLEDLKSEKSRLLTNIEDLKGERNHLYTNIGDLNSENSHLLTNLEHMKSENSHLLSNIEDLKNENSGISSIIESAREKHVLAALEVELLKNDLMMSNDEHLWTTEKMLEMFVTCNELDMFVFETCRCKNKPVRKFLCSNPSTPTSR